MNLATKVPRIPKHCVWEITTACNLRCIHCEIEAGRRAHDELDTEVALNIADDLAAAGCNSVSLTGGEPLLSRDWPKIARALADAGVQVKVVTNGVLVDEDVLTQMIDAGVTGVSVSIDGLREVHDAIRVPAAPMPSRYDAALRALELLVASPLKTAVLTQIHKGNLGFLDELYELLCSIGVDTWQVQLAFPLGRLLSYQSDYLILPSQLPALEQTLAQLAAEGTVALIASDNIGYYGRHEPLLRRALHGVGAFWTGCMAGCLGLCICSNGDVKGCPSLPREFVVGNLRNESFDAIWGDAERFAFNTAWREELLEGDCAKCPHRRLCRAGCTTMAYAVTGTIYDNPFCLQRAEP